MLILAQNKGVAHKYELLEEFEAGISLLGFEVKAIRARKADLTGAFVRIDQGLPYLVGAHIGAYQPFNTPKDYQPRRPRKLLLTASEINTLIGKTSQKGLTLVPISLYTKGAWIKVSFALARIQKKRDLRDKIKEKEFKRRKAKLEGRSI